MNKHEVKPLVQPLACVCWGGQAFGQETTETSLTLGKSRRVVVDVCQSDVHRGGARKAPHLAAHVLGLDHHLVLLPVFSAHVWQCCFYNAFWKSRDIIYNSITDF